MHKNARRVDAVGVEFSFGHELLDFRHGDAAGHGHHGVEVSGSRLVDEIARRVALPRLHQCEVRSEGRFENVGLAVEHSHLLPFCDFRAVAGRCEKGGDARATCATALGE